MLNHLSPLWLMVGALLGVSCSSKPQKNTKGHPAWGPRAEAIIQAGRELGVNPHVLMVAAYTQSRFISSPRVGAEGGTLSLYQTPLSPGEETDLSQALSLPPRHPLAHSHWAQSLIVGRRLQSAKHLFTPKTPFQWLSLMAEALIESPKKDPLHNRSREILLSEMVKTYNEGLRIVFPDQEVIALPPPRELDRVDLKTLSLAEQQRFFNLRRQGQTPWEIGIPGNPLAAAQGKSGAESPDIHIRWCNGSQTQCFQRLAQSESHGTHLLVLRTLDGHRVFQFHPLSKDLKWGDEVVDNTLIITLCGPLGEDGSSQEWLDGEDYTFLRRVIWESWAAHVYPSDDEDPLGVPMGPVPPEQWGSISYETQESGASSSSNPFWASPVPMDFDRALLGELLKSPPQEGAPTGGPFVSQPNEGENFKGGVVHLHLIPEKEAREVSIFKDLRTGTGEVVWELILKQEYMPTHGSLRSSFSLGPLPSSGSPMRRFKIVTRDAQGDILSTTYRRFLVSNAAN